MRSVESGEDPAALASQVRKVLLRLARLENEQAADEAAHIPYWEPCPPSVSGRRAAARALLQEADALLAAEDEPAYATRWMTESPLNHRRDKK